MSVLYHTGAKEYNICLIWKILHGFAVAVIFFLQSAETRRLWYIFMSAPYRIIQQQTRMISLTNSSNKTRFFSQDSSCIVDFDSNQLHESLQRSMTWNEERQFTHTTIDSLFFDIQNLPSPNNSLKNDPIISTNSEDLTMKLIETRRTSDYVI
jgi:hypothetical protein